MCKIFKQIKEHNEHIKRLWFYVHLYNMESEVKACMKHQHMSLEEAMMEWDIYPYDTDKI